MDQFDGINFDSASFASATIRNTVTYISSGSIILLHHWASPDSIPTHINHPNSISIPIIPVQSTHIKYIISPQHQPCLSRSSPIKKSVLDITTQSNSSTVILLVASSNPAHSNIARSTNVMSSPGWSCPAPCSTRNYDYPVVLESICMVVFWEGDATTSGRWKDVDD